MYKPRSLRNREVVKYKKYYGDVRGAESPIDLEETGDGGP
jgi:hypothetical protein